MGQERARVVGSDVLAHDDEDLSLLLRGRLMEVCQSSFTEEAVNSAYVELIIV
ncbi:hypothetical protein NQZ68_006218 [Dissostichus eleginoides]|nr:hypothetical protein NQZ68_006218 [Dissostichus eleginoides]